MTRRLARPMLSSIFVVEGLDTLRNPGPRVKLAEPVAPDLAGKVGLPQDTELLVKINAGVQLGAGIMLSLGRFRRLASLALIGSIIPTTYAGHRFWEADDEGTKAQQRVHFLKNLSILGGLVLSAVDTEGRPSLGWRARRTSKKASMLTSVGAQMGAATVAKGKAKGQRSMAKGQRKLAKGQSKAAAAGAKATGRGARLGAGAAKLVAAKGAAGAAKAGKVASQRPTG